MPIGSYGALALKGANKRGSLSSFRKIGVPQNMHRSRLQESSAPRLGSEPHREHNLGRVPVMYLAALYVLRLNHSIMYQATSISVEPPNIALFDYDAVCFVWGLSFYKFLKHYNRYRFQYLVWSLPTCKNSSFQRNFMHFQFVESILYLHR